ncbi:hypothetical protein BDV93DRAFT_496865 [Ceratobasidium sp. AG-I]|nr:hypothetical protein BDV93DRAFT_496865 [Ceratobasidium sp. AG-I]
MTSEQDRGLESLSLDSYHGDSIVDWVNELLDPVLPDAPTDSSSTIAGNVGDLGNLDKTIVNLIARFDVIAQETASRLDTTIADVTRTMPRLHFDVQVMRESALSLQSALHTLQSNSATDTLFPASNTETTSALARLNTLSQTHSNMTAAHALLKKAESWSTLESDVTRLLASNEFDAAADRLASSSASLQVFEGTPEHETAKGLMVSLQNQLEAALSTAVVNAVNEMDLEACKRYYLIFGRIQRETEFKYYYNGIRRAGLVKLWATYPEHADEQAFSDFFSKFFGEFLALVHIERQNMAKVYPDAQECLGDFILTTVETLSPSLAQRLETQREPEGLAALVAALGTVEEFVSLAGKTLEAMALFSPSLSTGGTPGLTKSGSFRKPSHSRRASKRFSISQRDGAAKSLLKPGTNDLVEVDTLPQWQVALLEPFLEHQCDYGLLELKLLNHALQHKSSRTQVSSDGAKRLHDTITDALGLAEDAIPRCVAFTHTVGAYELVQAIDQFCADVFEMCRDVCLPSPSTTTASATAAASGTLPDEDLDYTAEDWSAFQLALRLLEGCRAAQDRLETLESRIRTRLAQAHRSALGVPRASTQLLNNSALNTPQNQALLAIWDARAIPEPESQSDEDKLLKHTRAAHGDFTKACQALVRDTILSPLKLRLAAYPNLSVWTEVDAVGPGQLKLPKFSVSATGSIQSVAEGLLNLPRLFEVYADDNALAFSLDTLPFVGSQAQNNQGEGETEGQGEENSSELVTSTWLSSLTLSLCSHLTTVILPAIPALSSLGARQLASDLEYLSNVVRTLGVEPEVLEEWRAVAEMSDQDGLAGVAERKGSDPVFGKVARLRGWM